MKWICLLSFFPAAALAFQRPGGAGAGAAAIRRPPSAARPGTAAATATGLGFLPEKFSRAEQCATHYGTCWLDELEELASGACV